MSKKNSSNIFNSLLGNFVPKYKEKVVKEKQLTESEKGELARREEIRKKLVAEGEYIPSLEYLETASPKASWVKAGLYGSKNPLGDEFQGVAADEKEKIIHERTVATMKTLKERGVKTAAEHFKLKI